MCHRLGTMHKRNSFSFLKNNFILFFSYCSGSLLLHRLFCSCGEQRLLSSCGAQASHCGGFSCCRVLVLGHTTYNSFASQVLQHRLNSCGAWGSCFVACGIFSDQGSKLSSALAGRFCTTELPGKPQKFIFWQFWSWKSKIKVSAGQVYPEASLLDL